MADNLNEAAVEDEENDEEVVDHETKCIIKILYRLDRADLQPTRENIRSIESGVTRLSLDGEGFDPIYVLSDCINELQDLEALDLDNNRLFFF